MLSFMAILVSHGPGSSSRRLPIRCQALRKVSWMASSAGRGGGDWGRGDHFLANRRRPPMLTAATPSNATISATSGTFAGWAGWAGWPVAARSDGVAGWLAAVDGLAATEVADGDGA